MITIPRGVRLLLATQPVDFRRGAHGLAALGEDPFSGTVLVFRAKRGDRVKILLWDGSGLESIRDHFLFWQSFRSMRRIEAHCRNARPERLRHSQSLANRRHRLSQAMVHSTIQRLGRTTN